MRGMELWRVANGKIAEHWGVVDISDVLAEGGRHALVALGRDGRPLDGPATLPPSRRGGRE